MAIDILKEYVPGIREHGIVTDSPSTFTGVQTYTAANTHSGLETFTGGLVGSVRANVTQGVTATYDVETTDSGRIYVGTATSGTQTYTLPAVATAGVYFTFIAGHASGEILITTDSTDTLVMTSFAAVGADADTGIVTVTTGIKNTAATNAIGDSITLVSSGTKWFSVGITSGIWASQ